MRVVSAAATALAAASALCAPSALAAPVDPIAAGPELLRRPPPAVPELAVSRPFRAEPLLVSGTDAYRDGEYLYQDYLFDDHGADAAAPGDDIRALIGRGGAHAGDLAYPGGEEFAGNAADLVEFRVRPTADALVYRITLNTVLEPEVAAVVIGIDEDGADGAPAAWPHDAGLSSPGVDAFITAWGTGGEVRRVAAGGSEPLPDGSVSIDTERNQMTIRVPRSVAGLDPGRRTWRYVAGAGVWDGSGFVSSAQGAPAIFNVGFRFHEPGAPGGLYEDEQARVLAARTTGPFRAEVDFSALEAGVERWIHGPSATQVRILASRLDVPEGIHAGDRVVFGGRLQPYGLHIPPGEPDEPRPLTIALHGSGGTYAWGAGHPGFLRAVGDERGSVVLSPHARGPHWRQPYALVDLFEAWADAARRVPLDAGRVAVSGYSAGGYHAFRVAMEYPDLFGAAFPVVAAARTTDGGDTNFLPMLGNLRWVPWLAWNGLADTTAPYAGIELTRQRADALGLRHEVWAFPAEHTALGELDEWGAAAVWLGEARVVRDPARIDYAITPSTWFPEHGLVADHAYWASGLRVRDERSDDTGAVRGRLVAESLAFGEGEAATEPVAGVHPGPPLPAAVTGRRRRAVPVRSQANELHLDLTNLAAVTVDGRRARLRADRPLTVRISSDGDATVSLALPFAGRDGARFRVGAGTHTYLLEPPGTDGGSPQ